MTDTVPAAGPEDFGTGAGAVVRRWLAEIGIAERHQKDYRSRVNKIVERYRDEKTRGQRGYAILYANTETLSGALYQQPPRPDVRRRFRDPDPVGRQAAQVLERSLEYATDAYDLDHAMHRVVADLALRGRGIARVRYEPTMEGRQEALPVEDGSMPEDATPTPDGSLVAPGESYDVVTAEDVPVDHVPGEDWLSDPEPDWTRKRWLAFRHLLTREEMDEQFGAISDEVTLDWTPKDLGEQADHIFRRAVVWEVWCKYDREVIWIAPSYKKAPLRTDDDPLGLSAFFPAPRPIVWASETGSDIPIPSFAQYQDQAAELDLIEQRIHKLVAELKRRGVYADTENGDTWRSLAKAGDNEFVPLKDPGGFFAAGGDLRRALYMEPVDGLVTVLVQLINQREQTKQAIYEITGISDLMRGQTVASETLGAQQLKAQFGTMRLAPKQGEVQRFARDIMRLQAEIMAEHFSADSLALMTGTAVPPEVMQVIRDDRLRGFKVEIETDSTLTNDAKSERQDRTEFLQAVGAFMTQMAPLVQMQAIPLDVAKALLMFGVRGFDVGSEVEDSLDQIGQPPQGQTMQQPAAPSPTGGPMPPQGGPPQLPPPQPGGLPARPALSLVPGGQG